MKFKQVTDRAILYELEDADKAAMLVQDFSERTMIEADQTDAAAHPWRFRSQLLHYVCIRRQLEAMLKARGIL